MQEVKFKFAIEIKTGVFSKTHARASKANFIRI